MVVAIHLQLSMTVFVPRSEEIPRRVSPDAMVIPTRMVEVFCTLLLAALWFGNSLSLLSSKVVPFGGGSAFALIDFNLLKWRLRFFIHASTLLKNLLPNCLHDLCSLCPKWFFGLHDGILTLASQRSH